MTFETHARRQAKALFDEIADRLLQDLSKTAREEAEACAAKARHETERAAEAKLAAALTDADEAASARMAAAIADAEQSAEARLAALRAEAERAADTKLAALRAEADTQIATVRTEGELQLATALADGEARLAAAAAINSGLRQSLEAAQQEASATRAESESELDRTRKALEGKLEKLRQERAQVLRERDEAVAQREAESKRASELGARLEAETRRGSELNERLAAEARRTNEAAERLAIEARRVTEAGETVEAARHDREALIDRVGAALRSIDRATSPSEILETLLEPLARDFSTAAILLVGASSLKGWRGRGTRSGAEVAALAIPTSGDSPVARAVAERKRVLMAAAGGKRPIGLWGTPVARVVAVPVFAADRVIAVAYAEDAEPSSPTSLTAFPGIGCQIVEMLIAHAALRLTARTPVAPPVDASTYSPARQARRLKMQEGVDVTVDGTQSALVDVSTTGAQILSPLAMPPNRVLRMMLRAGHDAVACKGRVMWARFEQARDAAAGYYRVGVKFTDIDQQAAERFLAGYGLVEVTR